MPSTIATITSSRNRAIIDTSHPSETTTGLPRSRTAPFPNVLNLPRLGRISRSRAGLEFPGPTAWPARWVWRAAGIKEHDSGRTDGGPAPARSAPAGRADRPGHRGEPAERDRVRDRPAAGGAGGRAVPAPFPPARPGTVLG